MSDTDCPTVTPPNRARRRRSGQVGRFLRMCFPTRRALSLALLVCLVAPAALIAAHIHENREFSPIDEAAHWDYVTRIANGGFPRLGERLQNSTLRVLSCRKTALSEPVAPPCSQRNLRPDQFAGGGYQYEAQQPPVYYAVTVPMRWVAMDIFRMGDVDGTRSTGIVWLCLGLFILWTAGRVVGLRPNAIAAVVLMLGSAPLVVYQTSTVSNGAASIFAGSVVLLLAALAWRNPGRWRVPVLALGGFVAVGIAEPNVLAVFVASAMFGVLGILDYSSSTRRVAKSFHDFFGAWWPAGGALLLGGLVSATTWIAISRGLATINPKDLPPFGILRTGSRGLPQIAREAVLMLGPVTDSYNTYRPTVSAAAINLGPVVDEMLRTLLLAGGLAGLFVHRRRLYHWMGILSVASLYLGGFLLGVGLWLNYDIDPGLSGRYGMSLGPFLALGLVAAIRGRWALRVLWTVALITFATTLSFTLVG
jgi:hypothetical protein